MPNEQPGPASKFGSSFPLLMVSDATRTQNDVASDANTISKEEYWQVIQPLPIFFRKNLVSGPLRGVLKVPTHDPIL
jgi:hypothetical protein